MSKNTNMHDERSAARLWAVQALYQMDIAGTPIEEIITEYKDHRFDLPLEGMELPEVDAAFFEEIMRGVVTHQRLLDVRVNKALREGWTLSRLDSTLRALMRAGAYEILCRDDVPVNVVSSQYTDMAHAFFEGAEAKMANALLDRLGKEKADDPLL
ncbi:MAG: transcription antitermination factor NusB [Parvibaculales bacterium]